MSERFHNPYNFIATPPRGDHRMPDGLRDEPPAGHHRWHATLLSGEIDVRMTATTPLLVLTDRPQTQVRRLQGEPAEHQHREIAVAVDADGVPRIDLPVSSVRGLLRSAFETVTNSRYTVFNHPEPLGYRAPADTTTLRPALIHPGGRVEILGDLVLGNKRLPAVATVPAWNHQLGI